MQPAFSPAFSAPLCLAGIALPRNPRKNQFAPQLLPEQIDQDRPASPFHMPEGPAIASGRALHASGDGMNRAPMLGRDQAGIGAHPRPPAAARVDQDLARPDQPALDEGAERDARSVAPRFEGHGIAAAPA